MLGELVSFRSGKGVQLHGMVYRRRGRRTTIIHVHGSLGNFYDNGFVPIMAKRYSEAGINFFSINTSCHDGIAEGDRSGQFEYVGGSRTKFCDCLYDIEAAVSFAKRFSERLILQGHSLGCDRVLYYLVNCAAGYDFVLLSPCDSYQLQANWIAPETVEEQVVRLKAGRSGDDEFDWLPSREYGVRGGSDWTYAIPITREAFLSIAEGPPYRLMKIKDPGNYRIEQRALAYIGGKDALQVWPHDVMFRYLRGRIGHVQELYVADGDHMLGGCEDHVINTIAQWVTAT